MVRFIRLRFFKCEECFKNVFVIDRFEDEVLYFFLYYFFEYIVYVFLIRIICFVIKYIKVVIFLN